ncbi:hypothetical protein E8E12_010575 [Didymella heteroderae]|uniref:Uncharacterized protein n=1 Tax=Didymella heteroderae TaxID=1769908 RepID=A0A9P5C4T0_9PLEO|nr:hypothetical protein E8E12_010575 [Didymella heteroderae]
MPIAFDLPRPLHKDAQLSRLRRFPSSHPCAIPAAPKSSVKKAIDAIKKRCKTPRDAVKHWLLFSARHLEISLRQCPVRPGSVLKEETCCGVGTRPERNENGILEASSVEDEDDAACNSGVDMSEKEIMNVLQEKLWVVEGGGARAWWKMSTPPVFSVETWARGEDLIVTHYF